MALRKKLGEILVEQGATTPDDLKRALGHQRQWGGKTGRILVEMGAIGEDQLTRALAVQSRMPTAKLKASLEQDVAALVPLDLAEKHQAIAFGIRKSEASETVYVAVADPYDMAGMDAVRFRIGKPVKFALAPANEITRLIDSCLKGGSSEGLASDLPGIEASPLPAAADPLDELGLGMAPSAGAAGELDDLLGLAPPAPPRNQVSSELDELLGATASAAETTPPSILDDLFSLPPAAAAPAQAELPKPGISVTRFAPRAKAAAPAPPGPVPPTPAPPTLAPPTLAPPTLAPPTLAPPTLAPPTLAPPRLVPPTLTPAVVPGTLVAEAEAPAPVLELAAEDIAETPAAELELSLDDAEQSALDAEEAAGSERLELALAADEAAALGTFETGAGLELPAGEETLQLEDPEALVGGWHGHAVQAPPEPPQSSPEAPDAQGAIDGETAATPEASAAEADGAGWFATDVEAGAEVAGSDELFGNAGQDFSEESAPAPDAGVTNATEGDPVDATGWMDSGDYAPAVPAESSGVDGWSETPASSAEQTEAAGIAGEEAAWFDATAPQEPLFEEHSAGVSPSAGTLAPVPAAAQEADEWFAGGEPQSPEATVFEDAESSSLTGAEGAAPFGRAADVPPFDSEAAAQPEVSSKPGLEAGEESAEPTQPLEAVVGFEVPEGSATELLSQAADAFETRETADATSAADAALAPQDDEIEVDFEFDEGSEAALDAPAEAGAQLSAASISAAESGAAVAGAPAPELEAPAADSDSRETLAAETEELPARTEIAELDESGGLDLFASEEPDSQPEPGGAPVEGSAPFADPTPEAWDGGTLRAAASEDSAAFALDAASAELDPSRSTGLRGGESESAPVAEEVPELAFEAPFDVIEDSDGSLESAEGGLDEPEDSPAPVEDALASTEEAIDFSESASVVVEDFSDGLDAALAPTEEAVAVSESASVVVEDFSDGLDAALSSTEEGVEVSESASVVVEDFSDGLDAALSSTEEAVEVSESASVVVEDFSDGPDAALASTEEAVEVSESASVVVEDFSDGPDAALASTEEALDVPASASIVVEDSAGGLDPAPEWSEEAFDVVESSPAAVQFAPEASLSADAAEAGFDQEVARAAEPEPTVDDALSPDFGSETHSVELAEEHASMSSVDLDEAAGLEPDTLRFEAQAEPEANVAPETGAAVTEGPSAVELAAGVFADGEAQEVSAPVTGPPQHAAEGDGESAGVLLEALARVARGEASDADRVALPPERLAAVALQLMLDRGWLTADDLVAKLK